MKPRFVLLSLMMCFLPQLANAQFIPNQAISQENQTARLCTTGRPESQIAGFTEAIAETGAQMRVPMADRNFERALQLWNPLAQSGDICSIIRYGQALKLAGQTEQALTWYQKGADTGSAFAQYVLAAYIRNDDVGTCSQMRELLEKSARQGYIHSIISLAQSYDNDNFCRDRNIELAKHWYEIGANVGSAVAQHNLGYLILTYGARSDYPRAWAWISLAQLQPVVAERRVEYEADYGTGYLRTLSRRMGQGGITEGLEAAQLICLETAACRNIAQDVLAGFFAGN